RGRRPPRRPAGARRGLPRRLHQGRRLQAEADPSAQGRGRLRQRHRRRLRPRGPAPDGRRGDRDGYRPRLHLPQIQSEPGRPRHAGGYGAKGEGNRRRPGPRLRRRRRPLRRGGRHRRGDLRRQDRPDAGPRPVGPAPNATFVVDVKSTGLYKTDAVLKANGATTVYWKTGHSYIKRKTAELTALAGFEKSGHFFPSGDLGHGYDDGLVAAGAVLAMLDRNPGKSLSELKSALPDAWTSLTMSPHCDDELKYDVLAKIVKEY